MSDPLALPNLGTPVPQAGTVIVQRHNGEQTQFQATTDSATTRGSVLAAAVAATNRGDTVVVGPGSYNTKNLLRSWSYSISSVARSSNVVTIQTSTAHGFNVGNSIRVYGVSDSTFVGEYIVASVADSTHLTYANNGSDGSSSGGVVQGLFAMYLHHGAIINQSSGSGGIFDDTSNGVNGAVWAKTTGAGILFANSANTSLVVSTQAIVNLRQANTRVELECSSLYSTGDPCIFISGSSSTTEFQCKAGSAVCTDATAVCINTAFRSHIDIERIIGKASTVNMGTVSITAENYLHADVIEATDALSGSAIALVTNGTSRLFVICNLIIGNIDYAGGAGRIDVGLIRGLLDVSGDSSASRQMVVHAHIDATAISTSSPAFTPTSGFTLTGLYLDNCRLNCGSAATVSISADTTLTIQVVGKLQSNKPKDANVTVATDTYVYP